MVSISKKKSPKKKSVTEEIKKHKTHLTGPHEKTRDGSKCLPPQEVSVFYRNKLAIEEDK